MDHAQTFNFPAPAGYDDALVLFRPKSAAKSTPAIVAPRVATTATILQPMHRIDPRALHVAEFATVIALVVIGKRLLSARDRATLIAESLHYTSDIPEDTDENRLAFEARIERGRA